MNEIKFLLRRNTHADPLIRMVLRHNDRKFVYSTGLKVKEKFWDKSRMRVTKKHPKHGVFNSKLNRFEEALTNAYDYFSNIDSEVSNAQLKSKLEKELIVNNKLKIISAVEIEPYIASYIKRITEEGNLAKGTIQGFDQLLSRWSDFREGHGKSFEDLNIDILKRFHSHMKSYGYSQSTREKIQRKLVTVLRYAENADKINVNSDYKLEYWKVGVPNDSVKVVMSDEEIKRIRDFNFPPGSTYDKVRDRWIIGFATGQRYSDFKTINRDNIREAKGKKYIEVIQKKTGKVVNIPLYDDVLKSLINMMVILLSILIKNSMTTSKRLHIKLELTTL